jgi:hypothetical protein
MTSRWVSASIFVLCMSAAPAFAQICGGGPSFGLYPMQLGMGLSLSDTAQTYGGSFGAGGRAMFASVNFGGANIDEVTFDEVTIEEIDDTALVLGFTVGSDNRLDSQGRIWLCPLGSLGYRIGPEIGQLDTNQLSLAGGGRLGVVAMDNGAVQAIPTFGISFVHQQFTFEIPNDEDESDSETFGVITLGIGLVFNEQTALIPTFDVPLGREDDSFVFRVNFVINFGGS